MNNSNNLKVKNMSADTMNINIIKSKNCNDEMESAVKNNILEYYFNLPIKSKKAFIKLVSEDFSVPDYKEYNNLLTINYSVSQLKLIAKYHKLKTTGNKEYLKKRLYNYLYFSYAIIIIQKSVRYNLTKKYIKLHGPGFYNKALCSNDIDFCTLDNLNNIPYNQFISFKDDNDHIYGFDILSLYNLFMKVTKNNKTRTSSESNSASSNLLNVQNPFTNIFFSYNVLKQLLEYIRLSNLLKIHIDLNYDDLAHLSINKQA